MKLFLGNNKDVLKTFESNSIDSIVTDPPYELGFMGKSWDSSGIAYDVELWSELLRVLKPGGHLLAFSGTRTYHRIAVAIEDAGFEIRDMIEWVYGSGFPKGLNIGKAVDKLQGNEREDAGEYKKPNGSNARKNVEAKAIWGNADGNDQRQTKGTSEFEGWGTALKPAHEPICMARKPLEQKTVAENCLKWGTGGINIDESRVEITDLKNEPGYRPNAKNHKFNADYSTSYQMHSNDGKHRANADEGYHNSLGRFPANLIHDGSEEVMACFPETKSGALKENHKSNVSKFGNNSIYQESITKNIYKNRDSDEGNASRFFKSIIYTSKPSKAERNKGCEPVFNLFEQSEGLEDKFKAGLDGADRDTNEPLDDVSERFRTQPSKNFHPTVKPIELCEYLIKMVTPKGGIVLDPFMGSGSTGCGAVKNGFDFVGIDLTPEYLEIAEKRIKRHMPF